MKVLERQHYLLLTLTPTQHFFLSFYKFSSCLLIEMFVLSFANFNWKIIYLKFNYDFIGFIPI